MIRKLVMKGIKAADAKISRFFDYGKDADGVYVSYHDLWINIGDETIQIYKTGDKPFVKTFRFRRAKTRKD